MRARGMLVMSMILVAVGARAGVCEVRVVIGNDALNGLVSSSDDNGFTNDLEVMIRHRRGDLAIGGSLLDRMITSSKYMRRSDLLELFARMTWFLDEHSTIELRAGPTVAGDLGGLAVQSRWHRLTGTGPRDPRKMPRRYMHELRTAAVLGMRAESGYGGPIRAYGTLDGQLALGNTGVTFAEGAAGVRVSSRIEEVEVAVFGEVALGRYHVEDRQLTLPGAYRAGWQTDRRVGVSLGASRYRISFAYHTNETSSGEAFSQLAFEWR